jgi:hypothetical protein
MKERNESIRLQLRSIIRNWIHGSEIGFANKSNVPIYEASLKIDSELIKLLEGNDITSGHDLEQAINNIPFAYRYLQMKYNDLGIPRIDAKPDDLTTGLQTIFGIEMFAQEFCECLRRIPSISKPPRAEVIGLLPNIKNTSLQIADIGCGSANLLGHYIQSPFALTKINDYREKVHLDPLSKISVSSVIGIDKNQIDPQWTDACTFQDSDPSDILALGESIKSAREQQFQSKLLGTDNVTYIQGNVFDLLKDESPHKQLRESFNLITTFYVIQYSHKTLVDWEQNVILPMLSDRGLWIGIDRAWAQSHHRTYNTYRVMLFQKQKNRLQQLGELCYLEANQYQIKDINKSLASRIIDY